MAHECASQNEEDNGLEFWTTLVLIKNNIVTFIQWYFYLNCVEKMMKSFLKKSRVNLLVQLCGYHCRCKTLRDGSDAEDCIRIHR